MNSHVDYIVEDGNHRLAGNIIAGRERTKAHISGSIDYMKEIYLYSPNIYLEIYNNKLDNIQNEQYDLKISEFIKSIYTKELIENNNSTIKFEINQKQFNLYTDIMDKHLYFKNKHNFSDKESFINRLNINFDSKNKFIVEMNKEDTIFFDNKKNISKLSKSLKI